MSDAKYGPTPVQLLHESLVSLRLLGRRSLLALLGIAVGSAAIVALLNIGHTATQDAMRAFKQMGTDRLVVNFPIVQNARPLPATLDTDSLLIAIPELADVAPLSFHALSVRKDGQLEQTTIVATTPNLARVINLHMAAGRFLSEFDTKNAFAVVGAKVAENLGTEGRPLTVGDRLQIGPYLFDVIGIAQARGSDALVPVTADQSIIIPINALRRLRPAPEIGSIVAKADPSTDLTLVARKLQDYLQNLFAGRAVDVQIPEQLLESMKHQANTFSYLLAGLGGISLLVGGVGVMNVMLMNVAERRREIGVRLALGARARDIRDLFLLEAATLSVAGALVGALLGTLSAYAFSRYSGWGFTLAPHALPLGIGTSLVAGLFFGIYPAISASRLQPVEALRDA